MRRFRACPIPGGPPTSIPDETSNPVTRSPLRCLRPGPGPVVPKTPVERQMIGLLQKFDLWDEDGSGELDEAEIVRRPQRQGRSLHRPERSIDFYDTSGNGKISLREAQAGYERAGEVGNQDPVLMPCASTNRKSCSRSTCCSTLARRTRSCRRTASGLQACARRWIFQSHGGAIHSGQCRQRSRPRLCRRSLRFRDVAQLRSGDGNGFLPCLHPRRGDVAPR